MNIHSAFRAIKDPNAPTTVPMEIFRAVLEDFHAMIGISPGLPEAQRNLLLGRIEGYMSEHAFFEPVTSRQDALDLIYAAHRAAKLAERTDLSINQRKERMRETLGEYLRKPEIPTPKPQLTMAK